MEEPAPPTDLATEVTAVRAALAAAFGGYSQYEHQDAARAVMGHFRTSGRLSRWPLDEVLAEFARQEAEQWEDMGAIEAEELKLLRDASAHPADLQALASVPPLATALPPEADDD